MSQEDMLGISVHDAQGVVTDLLEKLGGSNGQEWLSASKKFLRKEDPWPESNVFTLTVNYDLSIEDAAGNYDWVNDNITNRNFPLTRRGTETIEAHLVHFGRVMTSDEVLDELDKQGLRSATIEELLAFGADHPELQRQFPIIALGSVWVDPGGGRCVPVLWSFGRRRSVGLSWLGYEWLSRYRFAAVSK